MRPEVHEKHIDEILARRLQSDRQLSAALVQIIAEQAGIPLTFENVMVDRQVRHEGSAGTIDLLVRLLGATSETGRILIENKRDSSFTPSQPERYAASAVAMARAGRPALPVVCAPAQYLERSRYLAPFRARLSYEEIRDRLDGEDRLVLENAIRRLAMPYEPDPVPQVRDFFEGYTLLAREMAPELVIKRNPNVTGDRPRDSRTIYFDCSKTLPKLSFLPTLRFSHQCWDTRAPSPSVKIMFSGWAVHAAILRQHAKAVLGNTNFYLRPAGGSLGVVRDTPRMDNLRPISEQVQAVASGIRAAASLRAWMFAHETTLREWAAAVQG